MDISGNGAAVLTSAVAGRILERAFPGVRLTSFEPLSGGLMNGVYRLGADGMESDLVLRVYLRDPSACQREVALHRLAAGAVAVPEIVYADLCGDEETGPHVLMRWIEGQTFREIKSRRDRREMGEAAHSIGSTLARIGSIPFAAESVSAPFALANVATRVDGSQHLRICEYLDRWRPRMAALGGWQGLRHGDFSSRNLLLRRVEGRWTVVSVLDWERAGSGPPYFDMGSILRYDRRSCPLMERDFADGYREAGGKLEEDWRELARAFDLVRVCQSLAQPSLPPDIVCELVERVMATIENRDPVLA